jgi:uncharacterized protein (UPF0333 family)
MKGQISAEMLVLIVVVLALVAIVSIQLLSSGKETSKTIDSQTQRLTNLSISATKSAAGERCINNEDCIDGLTCNSNYRCEN